MNCQEFSSIVSELARRQLMNVSSRDAAMSHVAACQLCAVRLMNEKTLSAGLHAVAVLTETCEAPPRLENALLAAFRQQSATAAAEAVPSSAVVIQHPSARRWWLLAAAAAVVLLMIYSASLTGSMKQNQSPSVARGPERAPATTDVARNELPEKPEKKDVTEPDMAVPELPPRRHLIMPRNNVSVVSVNNAGRRAPRRSRPLSETANRFEEIYSDFIPLTQDLSPMESGHVMRVNVPRSALPKFGLPMNPQRASETIPAEVLMSDDGMARAIRFANTVPVRMNRR